MSHTVEDQGPLSPDEVADNRGRIEARDVRIVFRSRRRRTVAVDGLDLTVEPGQFVTILGPSGCGKSSLLMALAGLRAPTLGEINVNGHLVTEPYDGLGMVFQRDLLLPWRTVRENVLLQIELMGRNSKDYRERCDELLHTVGLGGFEDSYPRELSGGMRQRVALCRGLIHEPSVLLMDEPFGALDAMTREQINIDVARMCRAWEVTAVLVTHSIDEAVFLGNEVTIMSPRPGRLVTSLEVQLEQPRTLAMRSSTEFAAYTAKARAALEGVGVLHA